MLGASYYFYMSWFSPYCLLLAGLTVSNYFLGLAIANAPEQLARRKVIFLDRSGAEFGLPCFFQVRELFARPFFTAIETGDSSAAPLALLGRHYI